MAIITWLQNILVSAQEWLRHNIAAWTKWVTLCRIHFQMHFLQQKKSILIFLNFASEVEINQEWFRSCLAPSHHDPVHWHMHHQASKSYKLMLQSLKPMAVNSSPPGQNGCHFTDDIFRCIFVNEKSCILIKILLKFVPKAPMDNNPALV